jgi:hypothetical protein
MAKAVTEVAVGAAAIAAAALIPGAGIAAAAAFLHVSAGALTGALVSIGASEIMAGLAAAMQTNHAGVAVGVTTPVGPWGYIYGRQMVGGIEIFRESNSSQGTSNNKELHRVYVLACHPCALGSWQLRIDGKQVLVTNDGAGYKSVEPTQQSSAIASISRTAGVVTMVLTSDIFDADGTTLQVRNAGDNTLNGTWTVTQPNPSDTKTFTYVCGGPDTTTLHSGSAQTTYANYLDKIYIELLDGNHTATFEGLLASGTTWSASDLCLGHTLAYVRMGYDESVFPSGIPNVSWVIDGKNDILDPRTGVRGYSNNPALCIADFLSLPSKRGGFGLAIGSDIPTTPLIAAANICDEHVALAGGGFTHRYTCDTYFQLDQSRGTILENMLTSCAGRITYQGGQYFIVPGAWITPTLQLTDADLVGPLKWSPRLSIRDTANSVKGTYVSPENNYQLADVPAYAQDPLHGYVSDPWLAEDNGERIYRDAHFPCTDSSAIAQRLAKIALFRIRYQGRGTFVCSLKAYQAVALDIVQMTHPRYTWLAKNFEVLESRLVFEPVEGGGLCPRVELDVAETSPDGYDWTITEQLTPEGYKQPNNVGVRVCAPPEDVTGYSGTGDVINGITYPSTITTGADGRVQNSIYVRWLQPNDANVVFGGHIEVQQQLASASTWTGLTRIDPSADHVFIPNVTDGAQYNIRVRAVNTASVPSDWIEIGPVTVGDAYSGSSTTVRPIAPPGTLSAQGLSDGTAQITAIPFDPTNGLPHCIPTPAIMSGLNQSQLYHVYFVNATFSGGVITPIATQNAADYENKVGYFLIGDIVTPQLYAALSAQQLLRRGQLHHHQPRGRL